METSTLVCLSVFSCTLFYIIGPARFGLTMKIVYLLTKLFVCSTYTTLKKYTKRVFRPQTHVALPARVSTPEEREMDLKRPKMRRPQTPQLIDKNQDSVYKPLLSTSTVAANDMVVSFTAQQPSAEDTRNIIPHPEECTDIRESVVVITPCTKSNLDENTMCAQSEESKRSEESATYDLIPRTLESSISDNEL